jgi:DNA-binding IclR family transcriptional regulator
MMNASPRTAPELAELCGLNRSTAWRILATLEEEGLVDRQSSRYAIGHLEELSRQTGETVSLAVPRRLRLVYVDQVQAPHVMAADWLGRAVPLHATSTGKALLAFMPPEELDTVITQPLPQFTGRTITDPAELRAELDRTRRRGYAVSRGELETALWGASAPIKDSHERAVAVVSVWGAEGRLKAKGRLDELGRAAAETASAVAG